MPILLIFLSVGSVSLLSLLGMIFLFIDERIIRSVLLYIVSLSTGALLGDVFLHIIPDLAEDVATFTTSLLVLLGGILFSFALEKLIHWRHCHILPSGKHYHPMGLINLFGESMHNFIDGLVIASAFLASVPIGISTTLAVALHEIPHEVGNVAVLLHSGYSRSRAVLFNIAAAMMSLAGALLVTLTAASSQGMSAVMLPFAAGNLLYIAGSDLIPELHKETGFRQGIGQLFCMIVGMMLMYGLKMIESM